MTAAVALKHEQPFSLERVTGKIGAEVSGLDLAAPLDQEVINALYDALVARKVLFFRDQDITHDQHLALGRRFGPVEIHPFAARASKFENSSQHPEIIVLDHKGRKAGNGEDLWHSDVTWRQEPSLGSILRARVSPSVGGDTVWADMEAAYDALDAETKAEVADLFAVHDWQIFRQGLRDKGVPEAAIEELNAEFPSVRHPVIRTHPVTGRKAIFVNRAFTVRIEGVSAERSEMLLDRLCRMATLPELQVRLRWRPNTIAFWDNRSTQHYAIADYDEHRRMERVTIAGDRPV